MSLKLSCLKAADNNVQKAKELYEFLCSDIQDIPDFEPVAPSTFESIKRGATEVLGWIDTHKEDVAQGISFIQSLRRSAPGMTTNTDVPPIPKP